MMAVAVATSAKIGQAIAGANGPGVVVGQQIVGRMGEGEALVATTVQARVASSSALGTFGPAVEITGSERPVDLTYSPQGSNDPANLSAGERHAIDQLRIRDAQVRQEEKAHAAAAGDLGGTIQYNYVTGPDGRSYAVGGHVPISATIDSSNPARAESVASRLQAAGLAATNPSAADQAVTRLGYNAAGQARQAEAVRTIDIGA